MSLCPPTDLPHVRGTFQEIKEEPELTERASGQMMCWRPILLMLLSTT